MQEVLAAAQVAVSAIIGPPSTSSAGAFYLMSTNATSIAQPGQATTTPRTPPMFDGFVCALLFARDHHQLHGPLGLLLHRAAAAQCAVYGLGLQSGGPVPSARLRQQLRQRPSSYFQIAYGVAFLISQAASSTGSAPRSATPSPSLSGAALSSLSHSLVGSVIGFSIARVFLGLGEGRKLPRRHQSHHRVVPYRRTRLCRRHLQLRHLRVFLSCCRSSSATPPPTTDGAPPSSPLVRSA